MLTRELVSRRRWVGSLLILFSLLVGSGCSDASSTLTLKLGHVGSPGSLYDYCTREFARRVNETLSPRLSIDVFGSSQLGGDEVLLQKLKLGTVDLSLPSTVLSSQIAEFGLFEMPYLIEDREHMRRIEEEIVWPVLAPLAEENGYKLLAVWENGFRHVTNNLRPVIRVDDLSGIKLRTPRGIWRVKLFEALGANPSPMAFSEVFVALQTGVMDGQENPLAQIYSARLHEVQSYLSLTAHVYTPAFLVIGVERWNAFSPEFQEILGSTARHMSDLVYRKAEEMDRELLALLRNSGISVNDIDREEFARNSRPFYRQFTETVPGGEEMLNRARALGRN